MPQAVASLTCLDTVLTCIFQAVACERAQLLFPLSVLPFMENEYNLETSMDGLHPSFMWLCAPPPSVSQTHSSLHSIAHPDSI